MTGSPWDALTVAEREAYDDGTWLGWDSESGPRCELCGCLATNHTVHGCEVCECPGYWGPE